MTCDWEQYKNSSEKEMKEIYSGIALNHATNPRNAGDMKDADGFANIASARLQWRYQFMVQDSKI